MARCWTLSHSILYPFEQGGVEVVELGEAPGTFEEFILGSPPGSDDLEGADGWHGPRAAEFGHDALVLAFVVAAEAATASASPSSNFTFTKSE